MKPNEVIEYFDPDDTSRFTVDFEYNARWPGRILAERWFNRAGDKDAVRGRPAEIIYDPETGNKIAESYYRFGYLGSPDKETPAVRYWDAKTQNVVLEMFYYVDDLNREDGLPAIIEYDPETGDVIRQEFYQNGRKIVPNQESPDFSP